MDVAYGGNYYAIVEPQGAYTGLDALGASRLIELSAQVRDACARGSSPCIRSSRPSAASVTCCGPTGPRGEGADARNAVFYGERAIDRSPCGTGTRRAWRSSPPAAGCEPGERFVHESYIGSRFTGRVEEQVQLGGHEAIVPSIEGSAHRHRLQYASGSTKPIRSGADFR